MNNNYSGLRAVGKILQVLAWIALVLGFIAAIIVLSALKNILPNTGGGIRLGIAVAVLLSVGVTNFFQLFIIGGLVDVFTDMADHIASQNVALDRLTKAVTEAAKPPPPSPTPPPPPPPA